MHEKFKTYSYGDGHLWLARMHPSHFHVMDVNTLSRLTSLISFLLTWLGSVWSSRVWFAAWVPRSGDEYSEVEASKWKRLYYKIWYRKYCQKLKKLLQDDNTPVWKKGARF